VVGRNFTSQVTQQWNFTAERQVHESWSVRASYLGSQSHHLLLNGADIDIPTVQQPNVPFQEQRPLQPWSGIYYYTPAGTANFHQLQLEIQKQFSQGLSFRTEYDWSHQLQNVQYECCSPQNPLNLRGEYGNDFLQYRHRFLTYYVYELPVGRGRRWLGHTNTVADGVLGGWRLAGITTYHSGEALDVYLEDPGTKIGWWVGRADRVAGAPLYAGRQSSSHDTGNGVPWFNANAFAPPQPWTYGNSAARLLFGPGFGNWDLSAMRSFPLPHGESNRLEFKADFFNLPNHYNLGDPNNCLADTRDGGNADPTCGKIYYGVGAPRLIQLGLRLFF